MVAAASGADWWARIMAAVGVLIALGKWADDIWLRPRREHQARRLDRYQQYVEQHVLGVRDAIKELDDRSYKWYEAAIHRNEEEAIKHATAIVECAGRAAMHGAESGHPELKERTSRLFELRSLRLLYIGNKIPRVSRDHIPSYKSDIDSTASEVLQLTEEILRGNR